MSKSPSPHPTNNPTNSSPSSEIPHTSTSRTQTHEAHIAVVEHNSPTSSSHPTLIHPSTPEPSAGPSRTRARENDTLSQQSMAKRFRVEPVRARQSDRSSPSSDSQGGMADTEDGEQSHRSGRSPAPSEPPKKKRTRTLTTPHQSSVLHALLAQVGIISLDIAAVIDCFCSHVFLLLPCGRKLVGQSDSAPGKYK